MRLLFCVLFFLVVVHAQLIQFQQPNSGKELANGDTVLFSWTIVGQHAGTWQKSTFMLRDFGFQKLNDSLMQWTVTQSTHRWRPITTLRLSHSYTRGPKTATLPQPFKYRRPAVLVLARVLIQLGTWLTPPPGNCPTADCFIDIRPISIRFHSSLNQCTIRLAAIPQVLKSSPFKLLCLWRTTLRLSQSASDLLTHWIKYVLRVGPNDFCDTCDAQYEGLGITDHVTPH